MAEMPFQKHTAALKPGSRSRRQNRSCDQCRKAKRACDALARNIHAQRLPCSYCAKTNKRCTLEWAQSRAQPALGIPRNPTHSQVPIQHLSFPWKAHELQVEAESKARSDICGPSFIQEFPTWGKESANGREVGPLLDYNEMMPMSISNENDTFHEQYQTDITETLNDARSLTDPMLQYSSIPSRICAQQPLSPEVDLLNHQMRLGTWPSQRSHGPSSLRSNSLKSPPRLGNRADIPPNRQYRHRDSPLRSPSAFSIDQQMINTHNCQLTSANLFRIYHDGLEHHLSCWLNETTCPFQPASPNVASLAPPVQKWGSSRANSIFQRTMKLDHIAQSCKILQLTCSENQAASKALHLAIMAFATQWAQNSHRHRERYSFQPFNQFEQEITGTDEFDRILQNHFWDQAQHALQQVADLESYKVACAELIFGLIQGPWSPHERVFEYEPGDHGSNFGPKTSVIMASIQNIVHNEAPPIYIERAARKLQALKYRCAALEKGLSKQSGTHKNTPGIEAMSTEDRGTIGLLYWLAIMFDTVSSSMNERPLVILDQDCRHDGQKDIQRAAHRVNSVGDDRWNPNLFVQGDIKEGNPTHWPCSSETASQDVIKSAPVKVLLFRHLSYLQSAIRKDAHEEEIEDIINITTLIYEYWNRTHGVFFRELVQNYDAVPQRIQGWFLCISGHWHLAALMFADLLELIDENGLGITDASHARITTQLVRNIRKHSADELSDLARVGTPSTEENDSGVLQMPDFHHAVNEGTLLTEPWTMILIRAFTQACMVFLEEADELLRSSRPLLGHHYDYFECNMNRAEDCRKALWLLGKKSDMARHIAEMISVTLGKLRNEFFYII